MLARDVRLEGFTTDDWVRLAEVFRAPRRVEERDDPAERGEEPPSVAAPDAVQSGAPRKRRSGGVIAVSGGGRLRKLVSTRVGRLDLGAQPWPEPARELAERHGARWAAVIATGALDDLMERVASRLRREHDATDQILTFLQAVRELEAEGKLELWPWRAGSWPLPQQRTLVRALDAVCPDGKCVALGVFADGEVYSAIILRRKGNGFDLILGPDRLRPEMGLISGDWRRDYRHLARAAEAEAGPLALGCYGELATLRALLESPTPGAWATAVASRDVVLSPAPPALAIPLGIDVGRAAFVAVRDFAERSGLSAWFGPDSPLRPALSRLRDLTGTERDLRELIGFDPLALLARWFSGRGEDA